jgi:hypothetical protein
MGFANPHIMDLMGYQRMYEAWRKEAEAAGYLKNLRSVDGVNTVVVATSATGTGKEQQFFQTPDSTIAGDPQFYSPTTDFAPDGKVPSGTFMGLFSLALLISVQYGTITQLNTLLVGLGGGRLKAFIGTDPILSWIINSCLDSFDSGYFVSNDNATTSLVARTGFDHSQPRALPWVKNLNPAAQLTASFIYTLATIAVAFKATLLMGLFAGDKGTG